MKYLPQTTQLQIMKPLIVLLFLFIVSTSFAQVERENKLLFNFGVSLRVTPVDLEDKYMPYYARYVDYNRDSQVSGLCFNTGLMYYLAKPKIGFEAGVSARYMSLYTYNELTSDGKQGFTGDLHLNGYKFIPLRHSSLRMGVGYSSINHGSNYTFLAPHESNGVVVLVPREANFKFSTLNFSFGWQVRQFSFELVNRVTASHHYEPDGRLYIPELKVGYHLTLKNKKVF